MKRETLTLTELIAHLGVDKRTIYTVRNQPGFPRPFSLTGTTRGLLRWYKDEVDDWYNNQHRRTA